MSGGKHLIGGAAGSNESAGLPSNTVWSHYTTVVAERSGISWNEGFISPKKDPSECLAVPTLSLRRYRAMCL
jgi:hypothetical protein